jgi:hypothetical protein
MIVEKTLKKINERMKTKPKEKREAWEFWGEDFTKYFIQIYKGLFYKTSKGRVITARQLSESFKIVFEASHLWIPKLRESLKAEYKEYVFDFYKLKWELKERKPIEIDNGTFDILIHRLKEVFEDTSQTIESLNINNSLPSPITFATIAGILKWHLNYFLGHGDIWRYLPELVNRKKDAIRKALQRSDNEKIDYIREYKFEVMIYINQRFLPTISNKDVLTKVDEEIQRFIEWCENQEKKINQKDHFTTS